MNPAYIVTEVDPNQMMKEQQVSSAANLSAAATQESTVGAPMLTLHKGKRTTHMGDVPKVKIEALKYRNHKVTRVNGLEFFQIDLNEIKNHLRVKCSVSVTINEGVALKSGQAAPNILVLQGQMIREVEEAL